MTPDQHNEILGHGSHYAHTAVLAAAAQQLIPKAHLQDALAAQDAANSAKHECVKPSSIDPRQDNDSWSPNPLADTGSVDSQAANKSATFEQQVFTKATGLLTFTADRLSKSSAATVESARPLESPLRRVARHGLGVPVYTVLVDISDKLC